MNKKALFGVLCAALIWPAAGHAELEIEPLGQIATLPADYPSTWLFANDANFSSMIDGKVILLDIAADTKQYKGSFGASMMGSFLQSKDGKELYVAETFYSRHTRGTRTDVITIYDKENLAPIEEILLPENNRGQFVTQKATLQQTNDGKFILLSNFTPASSVTVINTTTRKIVNEIDTPGCSLIYPTGKRGFATQCGNGAMMTMVLDDTGQVAKEAHTKNFNDIDNDAMFMKMGKIKGVAYFPTFTGNVVPVDLNGKTAKNRKPWSLVSKAERVKGWRPGGWYIVSADTKGHLYVLMHENGIEGSHKNGGSEVWVFDVKKKVRIKRIMLKGWSISIEATKGDKPYLAVTNAEMSLDVYDAKSGKFLRNIGGQFAAMPLALYGVEAQH